MNRLFWWTHSLPSQNTRTQSLPRSTPNQCLPSFGANPSDLISTQLRIVILLKWMLIWNNLANEAAQSQIVLHYWRVPPLSSSRENQPEDHQQLCRRCSSGCRLVHQNCRKIDLIVPQQQTRQVNPSYLWSPGSKKGISCFPQKGVGPIALFDLPHWAQTMFLL